MKGTMPKYDWNVNGLAYGSNLLIKLDIADILRTQYEKFEDHFRNNEKVIYDPKIPLLVMETFSKFWKLWTEFPELRGVIPRSSFQNLCAEMSSFFQAEKDQSEETFSLCETVRLVDIEETGQPVPFLATQRHVLLDELQASAPYPAPPKTSPFAVPQQNLDLIDLSESPVGVTHPMPSFTIDPQMGEETSASGDTNSGILEAARDIILTQDLPGAIFKSNTEEPVVTVNKESQRFFKLPTSDDLHCGPCCREVSVIDETIEAHVQSAKHLKHQTMMIDCVYHLQQNKSVVWVECERTMKFKCSICYITQEGANCLIQHCRSRIHSMKMSKRGIFDDLHC